MVAAMVAAMVRTIFAQPDSGHVERQVREVAATIKRQFPLVTEILLDAGEDVTAFRHFPANHWQNYVETAIMLTGRSKPLFLTGID